MAPEKDHFDYQSPTEEQLAAINFIREQYKVARGALGNAPDSRQKSLAITKLEESLMWANKAVIFN